MEDHSVFYSRNLSQKANYCRRVHFFAADVAEVQRELSKLTLGAYGLGDRDTAGIHQHAERCHSFSQRYYLGFSIIRPLRGSPVGRTVLRTLPYIKKEDGTRRDMTCTRLYRVHLMGAELTVRGLAFQQQDVGVSACATVAVWSALHRLKITEEIAAATPAQITNFASQYRLPYGRSMPSEGLDVEQMCLAIQAMGVSPHLARVENFSQARSLLYSATRSGMPAILIMQLASDCHKVPARGPNSPSVKALTAPSSSPHEPKQLEVSSTVEGSSATSPPALSEARTLEAQTLDALPSASHHSNKPIADPTGEHTWHAVTVVGMKLSSQHSPCPATVGGAKAGNSGTADDMSGDLKAVYVHDDRLGPYLRSELGMSLTNQTQLTVQMEPHDAGSRTE
jgi:hypothetical protein